jgi:phosphocarrier protein HPr
MSGETLKRSVTVTNPHGFHMRPAARFAQRAGQFQCAVWLSREGQRVNGKSTMDLLLLAAEPGAEIVLEVSGPDAPAALEVLAALLAAGADESSEPPVPPKG